MSGSRRGIRNSTLTPAVVAAAAFMALAALVSVAFVTARGGLQMPVAATPEPPVAVASTPPTSGPASPPEPGATGAPGEVPSPIPSASPATAPSASAAASPPPSGPPDPLAALAACPGHPGCYLYVVRRGDTYSSVSDRYDVGLWIMAALNPEVADRQVIVVGQTLYLGHDPTARLDPCPDGSCHLYVVRSGDTLSQIAGRYGLSVAGIEALNPGLDPSAIVTGQVIRLPLYQPA